MNVGAVFVRRATAGWSDWSVGQGRCRHDPCMVFSCETRGDLMPESSIKQREQEA